MQHIIIIKVPWVSILQWLLTHSVLHWFLLPAYGSYHSFIFPTTKLCAVFRDISHQMRWSFCTFLVLLQKHVAPCKCTLVPTRPGLDPVEFSVEKYQCHYSIKKIKNELKWGLLFEFQPVTMKTVIDEISNLNPRKCPQLKGILNFKSDCLHRPWAAGCKAKCLWILQSMLCW